MNSSTVIRQGMPRRGLVDTELGSDATNDVFKFTRIDAFDRRQHGRR